MIARKNRVKITPMIVHTPKPPYYAVIFTSQRNTADPGGYDAMSEAMLKLSAQQPGFIGVESSRNSDGLGITVSYWTDLESIRGWKVESQHQDAQAKGKALWYSDYRVRICKVEREY